MEVLLDLLDDNMETVLPVLLRLLELDERHESEFARNRTKLAKLLPACYQLTDENCQSILAVMGNISSHGPFSDLVSISDQDPLYKLIISNIGLDTRRLAVSACLLGNLAISSEKVKLMTQISPQLIPKVMAGCLQMTSPFELQSAHLIRNISLCDEFASQILSNGGRTLVLSLMAVKLFPPIRRLGVQLAKNLVPIDVSLVNDLLELALVEDDGLVKDELESALVVSVDVLMRDEDGNKRLIEQAGSALLQGVLRQGTSPGAVLKCTRALGVVSSSSLRSILVSEENLLMTEKLLAISANTFQVPEQDAGSKATVERLVGGILNNVAFIAAKLRDLQHCDPSFREQCATVIERHAGS
jgi:hypothetical protein